MEQSDWDAYIPALCPNAKKPRVSPDPSSSSEGAGHETRVLWSPDDARRLIHSPFYCTWSGAGPKSLRVTHQQDKNVAVLLPSFQPPFAIIMGRGYKWVWSRVQ